MFISDESMFFSLLNHMIRLFDVGGEKTNYFVTDNNQYLFNSSSGLYVSEMVLFDKSNVRNSKIFTETILFINGKMSFYIRNTFFC